MPNSEAPRPDPDALLARVKDDEQRARRGRLRIFFGATAGVGKSYAMLEAARRQRADGIDIVVGYVELHGRPDTEALLEGLEILPPMRLEHRGITLTEFDLDGALARKPALLVVDELAHSNHPGARHAKRWQDVEELLAAGIDVYTTVNVQHLDSLHDVVAQITGVDVRETVPDRVFAGADEVELVDLPPDELLERLAEGKVYVPDKARHAAQSFFRKGNLIALGSSRCVRRPTASMPRCANTAIGTRSSRHGPRTNAFSSASDPIRSRCGSYDRPRAWRSALHSQWIAVYVETPRLVRLPRPRATAFCKRCASRASSAPKPRTFPAKASRRR